MQRSDYWPTPSVHQDYWEHYHNPYVYEYDPAEDGPEVEVINRILAADWFNEIQREHARI